MMMKPLDRLLIANRGEIAVRIARTANAMGIGTVAVFSGPDRGAPHIRACDRAVGIGGDSAATSYLSIPKLLAAARESGADAIHPGYGFLSENAAFARAVEAAGLIFVGPPAAAIEAMGDKANARKRIAAAGIPVVPGYNGDDQRLETLREEAAHIGFPVMIKASAGGGGRGMRLVENAKDFDPALRSATSEAAKAFGDGRIILERAIREPRHIEIQVFADASGNVVHMGERDCSIQRRHQKIIEESPSPALDADLRGRMGAAAVAIARAIGYVGAGTVEFLLDRERNFYFMEMNTRLQVEHPVTEALTGIDLVEWQLRVARGEALPLRQEDIGFRGHAIEARLCAESPGDDFMPRSGTLLAWQVPTGIRVDHAIEPGGTVSPFYDSMLGKFVAHGASRREAIGRLAAALDETVLLGIPTNRAFLARLLRHSAFIEGDAVSTAFISRYFPDNLSRRDTPDEIDWALAAWLAAAGGAQAERHAGWFGWSNGAALPRPWKLAHGRTSDVPREGTIAFARHGATIAIANSRCLVQGVPSAPDRAGEALVDGSRIAYRYAAADDRIYLHAAGRDFVFVSMSFAPPEAKAGQADGVSRATLNGKVAQIAVGVGDRVELGQSIMVLEAMKMEHHVVASRAGRVKSLGVALGDQVAPGQMLVEIVAPPSEPPGTEAHA
jgi:geranyl-CoA carboxylase alpha subunit